jgi:Xaa-Pro aminopeptidase
MRPALCLVAAMLPVLGGGISPSEYKQRRADLRKSLDGVMVLFGAEEGEDLHTAFFQETNFLYLSGWREPGAIMLLTRGEEILFLPPHNMQVEIFTGSKTAAEDSDAAEKTGFEKVLPRSAVESAYQRMIEKSRDIYTLPGEARAQKLLALAPLHEDRSAAPEIARLRVIKSPAEIERITEASDITVAAHLAAWKAIKSGVFEYEIAATMTNVYLQHGCERSAYAPIVGAGPDSVILHYMANHRRMAAGEVALMDVGAECSDYATDVTRTVPVNGKFTSRQRELYDVVLGAQKAAIAAVRPGAHMRGDKNSLQQIAYDYINSHGKDLHGDALGKYFTHGLGHYVGLDVHDPGDLNWALQAGMIITIEPGVYLPEENIGIRIEDTVLVTSSGAKLLSGGLPREPGEIEKRVGK